MGKMWVKLLGLFTWPKKYDKMNLTEFLWTWPTLWQQQTLLIELDRKINKYYDNSQPKSVNMTKMENYEVWL